MPTLRALLATATLLGTFTLPCLQAQTAPPEVTTLQVVSRLVFLDVTVLDKQNHPVVKGLTEADFSITEEKKLQRVFSFEAPESHVELTSSPEENASGSAPVTIFVLDLLNSTFEESGYLRYSLRKYLLAQPPRLDAAAELMVLNNTSLDLEQGYTRSREELLEALEDVPAALPYKLMNAGFSTERFVSSIDALQQIALQNIGVPGRKNIIWAGHGGPSLYTRTIGNSIVDRLNQYAHNTTNMLVNARMSLFVIYPGLSAKDFTPALGTIVELAQIGNNDPFSGDISFGAFVNETGGNLLFNNNDVRGEIERCQQLGSEYYTLTYQPPQGRMDGKFRHIRVTMRNPELHVVTKMGFFAPDRNAPVDPVQQTRFSLAAAARSSLPFEALEVTLHDLVRHPDKGTADFIAVVSSRNIGWHTTEQGQSETKLMVAVVGLSGRREILTSHVETMGVRAPTQNPTRLAGTITRVPVTIRVPRKTHEVRVVISAGENGRMGSAQFTSAALDAAPRLPTPPPPAAIPTQAPPL